MRVRDIFKVEHLTLAVISLVVFSQTMGIGSTKKPPSASGSSGVIEYVEKYIMPGAKREEVAMGVGSSENSSKLITVQDKKQDIQPGGQVSTKQTKAELPKLDSSNPASRSVRS